MGVASEIGKVATSGAAIGGVYIAALAFILADAIPTPADAFYFDEQRKLNEQVRTGKITYDQYWHRDALYYYGYNIIWWSLVFFITVLVKGDAKRKLLVFISLLSAGAVMGVIQSNIRKDKEMAMLQLQNKA